MITFTTQTTSQAINHFSFVYGYTHKTIADYMDMSASEFSRKFNYNDWSPLENRSLDEYMRSVIKGEPLVKKDTQRFFNM